jgi:fibronectin-binding autotransporter adhesin
MSRTRFATSQSASTSGVVALTAAILFSLLGPLPLRAQTTIFWNNSGSTFATGTNWVGGVAPTNNLTSNVGAFTNATVVSNPILNASRSINGLLFAAGTAAWTFSADASGADDVLTLGTGGIINNSTNTQTFADADLQIQLGANTTFSGSAGSILINSTVDRVQLGGFDLTLSGAVGGTIAADIRGTGNLIKTGTGTWTLSDVNTYSGSTTIGTAGGANAGTLALGINDALPGTAVNIFGGILDVNTRTDTIGALNLGGGAAGSTAQVTIGTGGVLTLGGTVTYNATNNPNGATISGAGTLALGGNRTFTVGDSTAAAADLTISTTVSGAFNIAKDGAGTLVLSGSNTYTGTTTVSAGVLNLQNNNALGTTATGTTVAAGAALELQNNITVTGEGLTLSGTGVGGNGALRNVSGTNTWTGATTLTVASEVQTDAGLLTVSGNITAANQSLAVDGAGNTTLAGTLSLGTGNITKTGAGTLIISGNNTSIGTNIITGGTLQVAANTNLGTGNITVDGGVLRTTGTMAITPTSRVLTIGTAGGTLDVATGTTLTYDGAVAGTGTLTKAGAGTFQTGGTAFNSWTGPLAVNAGTFEITKQGFVGAIDNAAAVTVSNGATLRFNGNAAYTQETIGSLSGGGTVINSGAAAVNFVISGASNTTFSGVITDTTNNLNLIKTGTSTLTLSGSNSYDGATTISNGVIIAASNTALGTASNGTTVVSGAGLALQGGITVSNETLSVAGTGVGGNGALRNLSGTNTWTGAITMTNDAEFQSDAGRMNIATNVTAAGFGLTVDGAGNTAVSGSLSLGTGGLTKTGGGTLFLTGSNTYTGGTLISGGSLQLGEGGTTGSLATNSTITNNGTLIFNRSDNIAQGSAFSSAPISGTGSLIQNGAGTVTLGASNTYSGTTTINTGAIRITNGSALGSVAGGTFVASGAALEIAGGISVVAEPIITLNGSGIGGAGALRNISGSNSYGGLITLGSSARVNADSGTLNLTNTATITGSGHTLSFGGAGNTILQSEIATGTGGLVKDGTGTLILAGNNSYTGGTLISAGTLQVGNGGADGTIAAGSAITNNAILSFRVGTSTRSIGSTITGTGSVVMDSPGGEVFLTASNGYTGGTTITAGQLHATTANSFGTGSVNIAGTNAINLAELHYTNSVSPLSVGPRTLDGNSLVALNAGSYVQSTGLVTVNSTNNFINISGNTWTNGTNLLITGTSVTLASGPTNILLTGATLNGGTLSLGGTTNVGRFTYTFNTNASSIFLVASGSALDLLWTGAENNTWNTSATNWREATNGLSPIPPDIPFVEDDNVWFGTAATTSPITVVAGGVHASEMTVTNTNGTVAFNGGQITAHNLTKRGAGNLVISNVLDLEGTLDPGVLLNTGSGNVTLAGAWTNGGLVQAGTGTVTLAVSNSFTGGTVISNGVVVTGTNGALGNGDLLVSGGTLSMGTTSQTAELVTLSNGAITGLDYHVENGTISVVLAGAAEMTKSGTGTVVLSGSNTFTGGVDVHEGVLQISTDANLGAASGGVDFDLTGNGILRTTAGFTSSRSFTFSTAGTVEVVTNALVLDGSLTGAGTLIKSGAGTLVINTDSNTQSGGMLISGGVLQVGTGGTVGALNGGSFTNNAALVINRSDAVLLTNIISGSGSLTNAGAGTLTLTAANTYSGATVISAGTVQVGNGGTNGSLAASGTITNNGTLIFNRSDDLAQGSDFSTAGISGTGNLVKQGAGTLTLNANNTYTGTTAVQSGTLVLASASSNAITGSSITVESGATLALAANDQIGNATGLILNGGTFVVGTDSAGYSDTLGTLTLSASSTIDLGSFTGLHSITFANSSAITWATNAVLTISNWQGVTRDPGDAGRILFGPGGLTSAQLAQIYWAPQTISGGVLINGDGELVPIPEPRVYAAAAALLAVVVWRERKRLFAQFKRS